MFSWMKSSEHPQLRKMNQWNVACIGGRMQPQPEQEEDVFHQKDYEWVLGDELAQTAKLELREDKDIRNQALRQFREWINKNQDLHKCCTDSNFLLRFLRVKKFSLPMAQQMLLKYLNLRQTFSHMFQNLDVLSSPVHELISSGYIVVSPKRDKQGRRVIITTAGRFDPYKFKNVDMAKAHMITYEACLDDEQTQIAGFTHVGDVADVSAAFITLWSPTEFSTIVKWGEQSVPMRHKEIHILNVPTALKYVYDFAHNRFSEKMKNRFIIHNSLEELHKKVDPQVLPKEYGGVMPLSQMTDLWMKELISKRGQLLALDDMKLLSNKGIMTRKNNNNNIYGGLNGIAGLPGSFRRLEVD
uniref:CRAL-TRIO domain-containing protein n=1 Tax=Timema monikensis TaxID=170555 RepID=A0A7R9E9H5_9NEOP|nr:unnamed protein product [Timema monikensis]